MRKKVLFLKENIYVIQVKRIKNINNGIFGFCSEEEKNLVIDKLKRNQGDIFKSSKLNEIANKNPILKSIDIFEEILDDMEKEIPMEYRENFYDNLSYLKIHIITDDSDNISDENNILVPAYYISSENELDIFYKVIKKCKRQIDLLIMSNQMTSEYHEHLKRILIHELFHLASSHYELNKHTLYSGFRTISLEKENDNVSLNEGFTEIITRRVYNNKETDSLTGYKPQIAIVNEIIDLVGYKKVLESYFKYDNFESIKTELLKLINHKKKVNDLFEILMKDDPYTPYYNGKDPITITQSTLFDYYEAKINELSNKNNIEEIAKLLKSLNYNFYQIMSDSFYANGYENCKEKNDNIEKFKNLTNYGVRLCNKNKVKYQRKRKKN